MNTTLTWLPLCDDFGKPILWNSECGRFQIVRCTQRKYRLLAFDYPPTEEWPTAKYWIWTFKSRLAAENAAEEMT